MGGGRGKKGNVKKKKSKSTLQQMKVSLEDLYNGVKKFLEVSRYRTCTTCKGSGSKIKDANTKCSGCNGKGMKTVQRQIPMGIIQQTIQCPDCKGEGSVIKEKDKCTGCKGEKVVQTKKTLEVDIKKGAPDGKRITFTGESDEFPDVQPGDIVIELMQEKHKKFIRKGADLVYNLDISLLEALTGFKVVLEHLDKRQIVIANKEGEIIKPGMLKTVKDLGMPFYERNYNNGNLYINFNIIFPTSLDKTQIEQINKVLINQKPKPNFEGIKEQYYVCDFNISDENTHHAGGKKENRRDEAGDDEDDESGHTQQARCAHQ